MAHPLIIQKEVDELVVKSVIETAIDYVDFYTHAFVVPKETGGLWPILNLKWFNHSMHIPTFKIPSIRHVWPLIQCGDYALSIDLRDTYWQIATY